MKKLKFTLFLCAFSLLLSCDTDRDDISLTSAEATELNLMVQNGEWRISQFTLNDLDKTADYKDYIFVFEKGNNLAANSSINQTEGTWRINSDSGSEYDSYYDLDFNLFFASNSKMGDLTRNYDVISANNDIIKLDLQMNENGDVATLTFSKN